MPLSGVEKTTNWKRKKGYKVYKKRYDLLRGYGFNSVRANSLKFKSNEHIFDMIIKKITNDEVTYEIPNSYYSLEYDLAVYIAKEHKEIIHLSIIKEVLLKQKLKVEHFRLTHNSIYGTFNIKIHYDTKDYVNNIILYQTLKKL